MGAVVTSQPVDPESPQPSAMPQPVPVMKPSPLGQYGLGGLGQVPSLISFAPVQPGTSCGKPAGALPGPVVMHVSEPHLPVIETSRAWPLDRASMVAPSCGLMFLPNFETRPVFWPAEAGVPLA